MNALPLLTTVLSCLAPQDPAPAAPAGNQPQHVEWQRSLADALAVQKATGLPLLIAVNMDGEVFNERFANTTYKDPEFITSTRGYVCVVASPDRHTERDYDALGNRVECPRFPGCTCSEHINIEPELFARYFNGNRNAPRHVGVSPDGKILFDRFLDTSMQTAIDAIAKHRGRPKDKDLAVPTSVEQLFHRRDAASRRALEQRYRAGDPSTRTALLSAAAKADNEPFDLLRMALRDTPQAFELAAAALANVATKDALIDLEDALARTDDAATTKSLLARLLQLGKTDKAAARLYSHFAWNDAARLPPPWRSQWAAPAFDATDRASIEAVLDRAEPVLRQKPDDDATRLAEATSQAALASLLAREGGKGVELWFEDAQRNAAKIATDALQAEAKAVVALAAWQRGDADGSQKAVALALSTVNGDRQPDAWLAARFLGTVMQTAAAAAYGKVNADAEANLHPEIERVELALRLLTERKALDETACLAGIGLLEYAQLRQRARQHLRALVAAFPASPAVHERWRNRLLIDLGAEVMREHYAAFVASAPASDKASAEWFGGYAALVAGEQHTRDARRDVALSAYTEAIERFARCAAGNADFADSANHFAVLSLAGRATLRQANGDSEGAVADLLKAAELRPASLDESDGLQRKPRAIAGRIARELTQQGKLELAEQLKPIMP
ncbi:MAG TPA: hypothetical protein VFZ65_02090 [Planctomycetota bacterium]|nr:hypothetical protein [Planctomycetota bacterium]